MEMNYDENALHQLEQELHTQIVPGTEVMADVGSHHFVKSSATSDQVLVPQPSDDPHDPLNWSTFWKSSTLTCATAATFVESMGPLSLAPMFPQLIKSFHSNLTDVVQFTGVAILVLGFSNFIWVPLSTSFGRRPVYLASLLICFSSAIWRARAQTYGSFMGACVLNGIAAGPSETLQPNVIADLMFLHERGAYQTLYFMSYFGSLMVGPIIAGPMAEYAGAGDKGWRNFWWSVLQLLQVLIVWLWDSLFGSRLNVGVIGAVFLMCLFGFPETKWHRTHPDEIRNTKAGNAVQSFNEKLSIEPKSGLNNLDRFTSTEAPDLSHVATAQRDPYLRRGRPSKQQFKLFQTNAHPFKSIALDLWIPWKLFAFPIVHFASFIVSWSASCFLTINLTQSQAFAAPPYEFKPLTIGFFNFAVLVGATIGLVTAGPLSDWISMKLTKRNNGIREPEMRLPTMIPYFILMLFGNFITAFGWKNGWSWKVIVIIGWACTGIQVASLPAIASTYAVDSYKPVSGSLFVSVTVNKNLWGYGFSKFITPWVIKQGFVPPIMTNMSLTALWCLSGIIFWFYGKRFRIWTRNSSVHRM